MKIIDNRYKIESLIDRDISCEYYLVSDLLNNNAKRLLVLFEHNGNEEMIEYLIENYLEFAGYNHKNLKRNIAFRLIQSIDARSTNLKLYYSISEYAKGKKLCIVKDSLNKKESLEILKNIISTIEYLHFRGMVYGVLSPESIYITKDSTVKINDMVSALILKNRADYSEKNKSFIAPELLMNKDAKNKELDYYSVEALYKYLLGKEKSFSEIKAEIFNGKQSDFNDERNLLHFGGKIVGRTQQIALLSDKFSEPNSKVISGDFGVGKTRLLREIYFRHKIKGNKVYCGALKSGKDDSINIFASMVESVTDDPYSRKMMEYKIELHNIFSTGKLNERARFRLFNRVCNYLDEFSKDKKLYFLIDDFQYASNFFLEGIGYLLNNTKNKNLIFVLSYDFNDINKKHDTERKINEWKEKCFLSFINLPELSVDEVGELIKNVLGIDYRPMNFATAIYKESRGNPRYTEQIIKHIYDMGELYIGENGRWKLKEEDYSRIDFPRVLDQDFETQLNYIIDKYFEYFKLLSICDENTPNDWLLRKVKSRKSIIDKNIKKLIDKGLVEEEKRPYGYSYRIKNHELKRSIYNMIPEKERTKLHGEFANFIMHSFSIENFHYLEKTIYHLAQANQGAKAYEIIKKYAELESNQKGPTLRFLWERAYFLNFDKTAEQKLEILDNLLKVYLPGNQVEKSQRYLEEYGKIAVESNNIYHLVKYKNRLIEIYYVTSQIEKVIKEIEDIEEIAEKHNDDLARITALIARARIMTEGGNISEAFLSLLEAKRLSEEKNISEHLHIINNRIGIIKYYRGEYEKAKDYFFLSIEQGKIKNNIFEMTRPLNNLANMCAEVYEDYAKSNEYFSLGIEIANEHDFPEVNIIFHVNMAENYIETGQYDVALEYLKKVNIDAIELKDFNILILANINMGNIHLIQSKFDKAFEIYSLLNSLDARNRITSQEILAQYYEFSGLFYGSMGAFYKANRCYRRAYDIAREYNEKSALKIKTYLFYQRFVVKRVYNKEEIENIRNEYKKTQLKADRKKALCNMAIIPILHNDFDYAKELLEEEATIKTQIVDDATDTTRQILNCILKGDKNEALDNLIKIEKNIKLNSLLETVTLKTETGYLLHRAGRDGEALKYFFDAFNLCYGMALKIPSVTFRHSLLNLVDLERIKSTTKSIIEEKYGVLVEGYELEKTDVMKDLRKCFDLSPIIDAIGVERFLNLYKPDYYGDATDISNVEELVTCLSNEAEYNVDLILKFMAKENFVNKAMIIAYGGTQNSYKTLASLNAEAGERVNTSLLRLSRDNGGLVINLGRDSETKGITKYIDREVKSLMVLPILDVESENHNEERRVVHNKIATNLYLYFESDNIFNKIDENSYNTIKKLSRLLLINIESLKYKNLASIDKLTKTLSRKYFDLKFDELTQLTKIDNFSFSVLMLDIDRFKNVNDTYGHKKGDQALTEIGGILNTSVRNTDLVGRYGGEEFIIILKNTKEKDALLIGEKIRESVQNHDFTDIEMTITISIGISHFPKDGQFKEDLIEKADQALYRAKEKGRNRVEEWEPSMFERRKRADKLAGIVQGNAELDNRNILALLETIEIIEKKVSREEKALTFLDKLYETTGAQQGAFIIFENNIETEILASGRYKKERIYGFTYNEKIVRDVIKSREGKYLIDWDLVNLKTKDGVPPDWQSIIVTPLIKNGIIKGVLYLTGSLSEKEFAYEDFSLVKSFSSIGAAIIS